MNIRYGNSRYTSQHVEDKNDGFGGFELYCESNGKKKKVASVILWDAIGQYSVQTFGTDIPLDVLEELIQETKDKEKLR